MLSALLPTTRTVSERARDHARTVSRRHPRTMAQAWAQAQDTRRRRLLAQAFHRGQAGPLAMAARLALRWARTTHGLDALGALSALALLASPLAASLALLS